MTPNDRQSATERYAWGCVGLVLAVLTTGLGIIAIGWLFGIGLRLSGV